MVTNITGLPKGIVVRIEIENREARVEVIDHIMLRPPPEEFQTETVLEADLLEAVVMEVIKFHHQGPITTGVSTPRYALLLLPRGLEAMEAQIHWGLIGTFVEEVVNMLTLALQDLHRLIIHRALLKVATVAIATITIEATGTEVTLRQNILD